MRATPGPRCIPTPFTTVYIRALQHYIPQHKRTDGNSSPGQIPFSYPWRSERGLNKKPGHGRTNSPKEHGWCESSIYQANLLSHTVWLGTLYIGTDKQAAAVKLVAAFHSSLSFSFLFGPFLRRHAAKICLSSVYFPLMVVQRRHLRHGWGNRPVGSVDVGQTPSFFGSLAHGFGKRVTIPCLFFLATI